MNNKESSVSSSSEDKMLKSMGVTIDGVNDIKNPNKGESESSQDPIWDYISETYGEEALKMDKKDLLALVSNPVPADDDGAASDMQRLKHCRIANGMTQQEFAEYIDVPFGTYVQWETGRRNPPQYVLNLIMKVIENDRKLDTRALESASIASCIGKVSFNAIKYVLSSIEPEGSDMIKNMKFSPRIEDTHNGQMSLVLCDFGSIEDLSDEMIMFATMMSNVADVEVQNLVDKLHDSIEEVLRNERVRKLRAEYPQLEKPFRERIRDREYDGDEPILSGLLH